MKRLLLMWLIAVILSGYVLYSNVLTAVSLSETLVADMVQGKSEIFVLANLSAYTSSTFECSGNPFVNASGGRPGKGSLACNWLPFGTIVKISGYDGIFVVDDRMNRRYGYPHMDIWMEDKQEARRFGRQKRIVYYTKERVNE